MLNHNLRSDRTVKYCQEINNQSKKKISESNTVDRTSQFILSKVKKKNYENKNDLDKVRLSYTRRNILRPKNINEVRDSSLKQNDRYDKPT